MPKIYLENLDEMIEAEFGETLLTALARHGFFFKASCGCGLCGKCRVQLLRGAVEGAESDADGWILSCRARIVEDIAIVAPRKTADIGNEVEKAVQKRAVGNVGIALDIGTTTVCTQLVDLHSGEVLDTCVRLNPQKAFGDDVIGRISAASQGETPRLQVLIRDCVAACIEDFRSRTGAKDISAMAVSGNTTMLHLFAGVDPSPMGRAPYTPQFLDAKELTGADLGLDVGRVLLLPSFSAFLGADVRAGIASLSVKKQTGATLLIDIGTNGEIALYDGKRLFCCSTAAGPALEGGGISCGMGGVDGAVNSVSYDEGKLTYTVLGGGAPEGICGSGLIDAIAVLVKSGTIDETGAFNASESALAARLGEGGFYICDNVTLTQRDIRQFQLAQSAMKSGVEILLTKAALKVEDVARFYIAGGMGFFIHQENAVTAGLFEAGLLGSMEVVGNVSLKGARLALTDTSFMAQVEELGRDVVIVDLAEEPDFFELYMNHMRF